MKIILNIKINSSEIIITLKRGDKTYIEKIKKAEETLNAFDKILRKSKIEIADIKSIRIDNLNKNKYTSYRILKSIEKAINFSI